jgi:hypothetical protein
MTRQLSGTCQNSTIADTCMLLVHQAAEVHPWVATLLTREYDALSLQERLAVLAALQQVADEQLTPDAIWQCWLMSMLVAGDIRPCLDQMTQLC